MEEGRYGEMSVINHVIITLPLHPYLFSSLLKVVPSVMQVWERTPKHGRKGLPLCFTPSYFTMLE